MVVQQRIRIGTNSEESDIAEIQQPGQTNTDIQSEPQDDIDQRRNHDSALIGIKNQRENQCCKQYDSHSFVTEGHILK